MSYDKEEVILWGEKMTDELRNKIKEIFKNIKKERCYCLEDCETNDNKSKFLNNFLDKVEDEKGNKKMVTYSIVLTEEQYQTIINFLEKVDGEKGE